MFFFFVINIVAILFFFTDTANIFYFEPFKENVAYMLKVKSDKSFQTISVSVVEFDVYPEPFQIPFYDFCGLNLYYINHLNFFKFALVSKNNRKETTAKPSELTAEEDFESAAKDFPVSVRVECKNSEVVRVFLKGVQVYDERATYTNFTQEKVCDALERASEAVTFPCSHKDLFFDRTPVQTALFNGTSEITVLVRFVRKRYPKGLDCYLFEFAEVEVSLSTGKGSEVYYVDIRTAKDSLESGTSFEKVFVAKSKKHEVHLRTVLIEDTLKIVKIEKLVLGKDRTCALEPNTETSDGEGVRVDKKIRPWHLFTLTAFIVVLLVGICTVVLFREKYIKKYKLMKKTAATV